ncbi:MAG: phosphatidate cytidylyltransferase [Gammaproteobacteria bacterium]|nr:phosphatidate cytidylyltransferase [Gammaproteobacteria bacterium]
MLLQRVITALILAPLVVAGIYLLPFAVYALVFWGLAAMGAWEWARLSGLTTVLPRAVFVAVFALTAALSWMFPASFTPLLWVGAGVWVLAAILVATYPKSSALIRRGWFAAILGQITILVAWVALLVVRAAPDGASWLLWALLLVWSADIGAYFVGHRFGRRKLAPSVSPGKTWEGFWGGMASSLLIGGGLLIAAVDGVLPGEISLLLLWSAIILGLGAVSVIGDLFESILKRARGVKNSGSLLPGHGGLLDRIDSILAVLPVFALILGSV